MSPREFLTTVLKDLSLEERESLMVDEKQRRNTFLINWPHDGNLSGVKMAQAGFYCLGACPPAKLVFTDVYAVNCVRCYILLLTLSRVLVFDVILN